jgi:hypothetical protein
MIKWKRKPHGHCPVQAEGYFMKHYFYFRSRGSQSTIEFAKTETDWEYQRYTAKYILLDMEDNYAAGWLPKWICRLLIWKGCIKFYFKQNKHKTI